MLLSRDNGPLVNLITPSQSGLMLQGMVESLLYLDGSTPVIIAGINRDSAKVFFLATD